MFEERGSSPVHGQVVLQGAAAAELRTREEVLLQAAAASHLLAIPMHTDAHELHTSDSLLVQYEGIQVQQNIPVYQYNALQ